MDGLNIINTPVRDLRGRFAVVPQSPFLFEGSLRYILVHPMLFLLDVIMILCVYLLLII